MAVTPAATKRPYRLLTLSNQFWSIWRTNAFKGVREDPETLEVGRPERPEAATPVSWKPVDRFVHCHHHLDSFSIPGC
jgi:hypothetical protein